MYINTYERALAPYSLKRQRFSAFSSSCVCVCVRVCMSERLQLFLCVNETVTCKHTKLTFMNKKQKEK